MRIRRKTSLLLSSALALTALSAAARADQDITLPAPIYLENFDALDELALPAGWTASNNTVTHVAGQDIDNLRSDTYKGWVVITKERMGDQHLNTQGEEVAGLKPGVFNQPSIVVNGVPVETLASGKFLYAESDVRSGSQEQYVFTKDYDLSGKNNVYAVFNSMYEQNQDNINSFEYSIDQGVTWLPGLYLIQRFNDTAVDNLPISEGDIFFDNAGNIDAVKTLNAARGDSAYAKPYGAFIGASITDELWSYISGRANDDAVESKRVEIVRLAKADNQANVRFRFMQAGTGSWYWGIDDFGLYSLPEARISIPPKNALANINGSVTLKVVASGTPPLTYQWFHDGVLLPGETSDTLTIANMTVEKAGGYTVTVKNDLAEVTNDPAANVIVIAQPQIDSQPSPVTVSAGADATVSVTASGPAPLSYQWQKDEQDIAGATSASYTVSKGKTTDSGSYRVVVTNPHGSVTSEPALLTFLDIPITQDLVLHLPLDTDANDISGRGNNGTPEVQLEGGSLPTFDGGGVQLIGAGAVHFSDGHDILLGSPEDLQFGIDTDFTFSFWVKGPDASAWTGDPAFISNKNWGSGGNNGYVVAAQGNGAWKWNWKASDHARRDVGPLGNVADGSWHNIVISHDRDGLASFYIDGSLRATQSIANDGDINSLDTYIGQDGTGRYGFDHDTGNLFKNVYFDDFAIWRRIITPQEVKSIFAHGLKGEDVTKASGAEVILPPTVGGLASQVANTGGSVTLTPVYTGTAPLTYQWQKGGVDIVGQTGATLTLNNLAATDEGDYRVIVTNSAGSATSSAATIKVKPGALKDDFVVHIPFDGNYNDTSGRNNNATPQGAPTLEAGKFGQAMRFTTVKDGSKIDYASLGTPADLNFGDSTDFSVSMWVNWTDSEDDLPFISNKDWLSSDNTGWGIFSQSGGNFRINVTGTPRGGANKMSSSATPTTAKDGTFHNIVVSFARGFVVSSYLDGKLVNTTPLLTTGSIDTGKPTNIGQDGNGNYTDNGGVRMTGLIDDVGIWRHALSAADAAAIYAAGQAGNSLSQYDATSNNLGSITWTVGNNQTTLNWTGGPGIRLQKATKLGPGADWVDVAGTDGQSSRTVNNGGDAGFYRLIK